MLGVAAGSARWHRWGALMKSTDLLERIARTNLTQAEVNELLAEASKHAVECVSLSVRPANRFVDPCQLALIIVGVATLALAAFASIALF